MLQEFKGSYIFKLQAKDLYNGELVIKEGRKRESVLDYSLGTKKIQEIANEVLPKTKAEKLFFEGENDKQYTNAVVSLGFDYKLNEYNKITIEEEVFYKHYLSDLTHTQIKEAYELEYFENGIYSDTIEPIEVIRIGAETNLTKEELPKGFRVIEGKIEEGSTGSKTIANSSELRELLYTKGFKLIFERKGKKSEVIEYVRFIRSAGQARQGQCLFIMKKLYKSVMKWLLLDMKFRKDVYMDLAGIEAYISLVFSSIIDTLEIKPENILLIDDYESKFITKGMVTTNKLIDGNMRLVTEPKEFEQSNSIWDGQSLMDVSLFGDKYKDKGMLLLRNRMFKSACFNTNIQKFFKDNKIVDISQLKGTTRAKKIEDIKLITTPSSIKYLKYGSFEDFLGKLESEFGIVKYDKPTHYFGGEMVQTHYQLINTLEFTPKLMEDFLQPSIDYMIKLKTDTEFLKEHLKIKDSNEIKLTGEETKDDFVFKMLSICPRFDETLMFKNFRKNLIKAYCKNIKRGHVLVNGNYSTLFGNGLEMLQESCGFFNGTSFLEIDEVYTKNFDYEAETVNSRSPHVANGNIWVSKNCGREKAVVFDKYFNLSKQIVIINSMNNNVLETLSGADYDSDTMLMTDNTILLELAKKNYGKYLTPTGNVSAKKVNRYYTDEDKAILDTATCSDLIGKIINCSQIINSRIWEAVKNGDEEKAKSLYVVTSQLDVMSNLAIDSAKREFNCDLEKEFKLIEEEYIRGDLKPKFFEFISKDKGNKVKKEKYRWYDTSMDYLLNIIEKASRKRVCENKTNIGLSLTGLLLDNKNSRKEHSKANRTGIVNIINKGLKSKNEINNIWSSEEIKSEDKFFKVKEIDNNFEFFIKNTTLRAIDLRTIIYKIEKNEEYSRARKYILSKIYKMRPELFLELFR